MRPTNRARPGRQRKGPVYFIVAFAALWILLIGAGLYWGGGSDEASGEANGSRDAGESAENGGSDSGAFADRNGQPSESQDEAGGPGDAATPTQGPDDAQDVSRNQEQEPRDSGTRLPRQSSGGEPVYDPLGKGAEASSLSQTDLERAELAAFRFVDAAYDFTGEGPSKRLDYLGEVGETVDAPEFWESPESPGSEVPDTVAARIAEYGVNNKAAFQSFEVEDTSSERVIGTATFTLDEGDGRKTYSQRLVLSRWAAVWRVLYAKPLQEVS
ncbi:MAG: hypothetical protein ACFB50_08305 [Rubrobacteraceae bacterium]